jgi:hypothetical protein
MHVRLNQIFTWNDNMPANFKIDILVPLKDQNVNKQLLWQKIKHANNSLR